MTAFHDNNVRSVEDIRTYQQMSRDGLLYLRNDLYLTLEWPSDLDKVTQIELMDNDVTRFAGYKFLIDGQGPTLTVISLITAWIPLTYLGPRTIQKYDQRPARHRTADLYTLYW